MRPACLAGLMFAAAASVVSCGCSDRGRTHVEVSADVSTSPAPDQSAPAQAVAGALLANQAGQASASEPALGLPVPPPDLTPQEKYDAALLSALDLMAERKYTDALASLETARAQQDTELIRNEIAKVKGLLEQQQAAAKTVDDLNTVLKDGNATEAAQLATAGLQQYGATDDADRLAQLKRHADALAGAQMTDAAARAAHFR